MELREKIADVFVGYSSDHSLAPIEAADLILDIPEIAEALRNLPQRITILPNTFGDEEEATPPR